MGARGSDEEGEEGESDDEDEDGEGGEEGGSDDDSDDEEAPTLTKRKRSFDVRTLLHTLTPLVERRGCPFCRSPSLQPPGRPTANWPRFPPGSRAGCPLTLPLNTGRAMSWVRWGVAPMGVG